jgi:hypothetical protein
MKKHWDPGGNTNRANAVADPSSGWTADPFLVQ